MRLRFQVKPWDLYAAVGYAAIMAAVLLVLNVGNLAAVLLVVFVPGYLLVALVFPGMTEGGKPEISWVDRIALSLGLSIAVVPLLGLLLNFTPWGIRFSSIVLTTTLFAIGVGYAAYWRRMRLPAERRLSLTVEVGVPNWNEYAGVDKVLTFALAASIVVAGGTLAFVVLAPRPGETFTEFYILGRGGNASAYPTNLTVNETGHVIVGVNNHEGASVNYTLRIDLVGVRIVYNATAGFNETVEVNRTTWTWQNLTVADGANWTEPYAFSIPKAGLWKVEFDLYKDPDLVNVYRVLHLYVTVT